ncbi:head-tail adaptor protein [Clostridium magnum]|uniref:Phage head-tail joining protein n=1 Tax=Clostridium magnum DSM 2767 TaxID=1121326 RepID=A0A161YRF8_9CLOT|nr:head-tail adaptor protein [Clostridium magnum]KZL93552.1 phage head-tail joining protein [Clostridium magnum DSM 2767]SHI60870.1 Phage head-tail joining protein [Clostridium magnum DSM 2767]
MNAGDLKHKIDIWGNVEVQNNAMEVDISPRKIKNVWASIIPLSGIVQTSQPNILVAKTSHKFRIRSNAFPLIKNDNWIIYKGIKYEIKYVQPDFKSNQFIEIFTEVITE